MEKTKMNSKVLHTNLRSNNLPTQNPSKEQSNDVFDGYAYGNPNLSDRCVWCAHWLGNACGAKDEKCNYEPYKKRK